MRSAAEQKLRASLRVALKEIDTSRVVKAVCEELGLDAVAVTYAVHKIQERLSKRN